MRTLRMLAWLFVLTGIVYPLLITGISYLSMPKKAQGSLLNYQGRVVGSSLIAQKFEGEKYFWPRPSAIDYQPLPSGGSNLGPTSLLLKKEVGRRRTAYFNKEIPSELLFASGSGVDPHLTLQAAYFQAARIAQTRQMELYKVHELIYSSMIKRRFGFLGVKHVNVLKLNCALDSLENKNESN
jgi:K+-transporting ATPase ATPase C chain